MPARISTRRLLGLDRSGPPPPATLSGQALNPWTLPNAIGFARAAGIPVFLVVALSMVIGAAFGYVSATAGAALMKKETAPA